MYHAKERNNLTQKEKTVSNLRGMSSPIKET